MTLRLGIFVTFCVLLVGGERIAEQKCREYREGTIQKSVMIPLIVNPKPVVLERFNCSKTVDLIVGGVAVNPGEFPHHALLGYNKSKYSSEIQYRCGGSLISERFVLTAAHCFKQEPVIVRLGANNLANEYENFLDIKIKRLIRHNEYHGSKSYHDIALVELNEDVSFSKLIRPACLWTSSKINVTSVIATGFGATGDAEPTSKIMQKVSLGFLSKSICHEKYGHFNKFNRGIIDQQLCIGFANGGKDTCQGDSGGPVQTLLEEKGCIYHVIGVTSAGTACGFGNSASIYTKVSAYIDWIEKHVWQS